MTVSQLIHHTSGLRDQWDLFRLGGQAMDNRLRQQQILNMVERQRALNFEPGGEFCYSNTGYTLLAEIVRVTAGCSLREFTTKRIFQPLGMTRTFFYDDVTEVVPDVAHSYSRATCAAAEQWHRALLNYDTVGATSLLTTVEDMVRWAANFANPLVGDRALIEQMCTSGVLTDGTPVNYGFALSAQRYAGHEAWAHTGEDAGFRSIFTYFPQSTLSVSIFANYPCDALDRLVSTIADIYVSDAAPDRVMSVGSPVINEDAALSEDLAGSYLNPFEPMISLQQEGTRLQWRFGTGAPLEVVFRVDGTFDLGDVYRRWSHFRPQRDTSGRIVALEDVARNLYTRFRRLERIERITPAPDAMAEIAGDYRSAELDITYTLAVDGDRLTARSLWSAAPLVFLPSSIDRFDSEYYSMRIARDGEARVTGIWIHGSRIRHVWLERLAPVG